ncbi:hypothetical protein J1781_01695 [Rahnella sp. C60]|uniref:Lipoprotein n=2 Tax=Yersiniaceae TaxID=1903411 RepID=A0ABS6L7J0_9GAMM|nr:hypothetical protein [Rahnella perminowiae]MBU9813571.1 hypothetical protein [Rahnella perminowiae]MBU9823647.1 hypothetical protein [Rahnella perminowiae]MBU9837514.1 hypothetical protein [Rahnella perminowiae]UJD91725.1 hypothetical protein FS594_16255 [Rahnella aquatilis]
MKKTLVALAALFLAGCAANPYEPTLQVKSSFANASATPPAGQTHIRLHRLEQWSVVPFEKTCPLMVFLDGQTVASLHFNQYVDLNVPNGIRTIDVRIACALTKTSGSITVDANGKSISLETDRSFFGTYNIRPAGSSNK